MQLYRVEMTSGLSETGTDVVYRYFSSFARARSFCNKAIRTSLARWKRYAHVKRLADVMGGEEIAIVSVKTPKLPTKTMFLLMLNHGDDIPLSLEIVEQWNPQDKWHKPKPRGEE